MARAFIFFVCVFVSFGSVFSAPLECVGNACPDMIAHYDPFIRNFTRDYLYPLSRDNLRAAAAIAFSPIPTTALLEGGAVGATINIGYTSRSILSVYDAYDDRQVRIPELGIAFTPLFYAGLNVGYVINSVRNLYLDITDCADSAALAKRGIDCKHYVKTPILSDFTVYTYGTKTGKRPSHTPKDVSKAGSATFDAYGVMIRYTLIDDKHVHTDFFSFDGLTIGMGWTRLSQENVLVLAEGDHFFKIGTTEFEWYGKNVFRYYMDMHTTYADLRASMRFWFLRMMIGIGVSNNYGTTTFRYNRAGIYQLGPNTADYLIDTSGTAEESFRPVRLLAGLGMGGFTLHFTSTLRRDSATNKHDYSASIGFVVNF